jgi:hypothetical protein
MYVYRYVFVFKVTGVTENGALRARIELKLLTSLISTQEYGGKRSALDSDRFTPGINRTEGRVGLRGGVDVVAKEQK